MENLLMEMVMHSTRRDRVDDPHPHREGQVEPGRRPKLRNRRRAERSGARIEPRLTLRPEHRFRAREHVLVIAVRRLLGLH